MKRQYLDVDNEVAENLIQLYRTNNFWKCTFVFAEEYNRRQDWTNNCLSVDHSRVLLYQGSQTGISQAVCGPPKWSVWPPTTFKLRKYPKIIRYLTDLQRNDARGHWVLVLCGPRGHISFQCGLWRHLSLRPLSYIQWQWFSTHDARELSKLSSINLAFWTLRWLAKKRQKG